MRVENWVARRTNRTHESERSSEAGSRREARAHGTATARGGSVLAARASARGVAARGGDGSGGDGGGETQGSSGRVGEGSTQHSVAGNAANASHAISEEHGRPAG